MLPLLNLKLCKYVCGTVACDVNKVDSRDADNHVDWPVYASILHRFNGAPLKRWRIDSVLTYHTWYAPPPLGKSILVRVCIMQCKTIANISWWSWNIETNDDVIERTAFKTHIFAKSRFGQVSSYGKALISGDISHIIILWALSIVMNMRQLLHALMNMCTYMHICVCPWMCSLKQLRVLGEPCADILRPCESLWVLGGPSADLVRPCASLRGLVF